MYFYAEPNQCLPERIVETARADLSIHHILKPTCLMYTIFFSV